MAGKSATSRRWKRSIPAIAIVATVGLLGGLAVVAQGYDAQEVPQVDTSVWVVRDAGQYARVNTELAEIDTVRGVQEPTAVVQQGSRSIVFSQGYRQLWPVSAANPVDLITEQPSSTEADQGATAEAADDGEGGAAEADEPAAPSMSNTPLGTRQVLSAGGRLLYLTDSGSVFLSEFAGFDGEAPTAFPLNPFAEAVVEEGEEAPTYSASAIALSPDGLVALYSGSESAIRLFDATTGEFAGSPVPVLNPPEPDARLELAVVGTTWVLSSPADGLAWIDGVDQPVDTGMSGETRLQESSTGSEHVYLADAGALVSIDLASGAVSELFEARGVPAAPIVVDGVAYAAWLATGSGTLWSSERTDGIPLQTDGDGLEEVQAITPAFHSNGQRAVLGERSSGMIWTVPDGALIPLSQWDVEDDDQEAGTVEVDDVAQQEPPVAVADSFGVRAGQSVLLPLLLNDHDPNKKDVLSVVPGSLSGGLAQPMFGDVGLVSNNQAAVIRVSAEAGTTTFTYAVTDGMSESAPASVTLTVVPADANTAPVWCGVEECKQEWPSPQIAPGGTVTVPVLSGWVDPEGDPIILADARKSDLSDPISVVPTADGRVAIRHNDPNAPAASIAITVVVVDARGAATEKELVVSVSSAPALVAAPVVLTAGIGEKTTIRVADHVSGGTGAYRVVDAVEASSTASGLVVVPNAAAGTVELVASAAGEYLVTYTVQDTATLAEQSALVRLSAVATTSPLAIAPVTALVRENEDTTVDILGAVQNTTGRVLIITQATSSDPQLSVNVVGQSRVRVSGTTADRQPGLIGTATVTVSDGSGATAEGQVAVFLVSPTTATNPIAIPDALTVRAGTQVDIPVLDNDLSPRGERMLVHPQLEGSGTPGELAFAGETVVRYLAPTTPGAFTLRYTTYLEGQPDRIDSASIAVTVLPPGSNRAPQPPILTARAMAGQTVVIPVDGHGMDPDGDSVVLADVEVPPAGQGVPSISADGTAIIYAAPAAGVLGGQVAFSYTVRDSQGEEAKGAVRVGVISALLADVTPITYNDYLRAQPGSSSPLTVFPLLNDRDPDQGELELIDLVPNAPKTPDNPEYQRLAALISPDTSFDSGKVVLVAGEVLGRHSFVYTVQSTTSSSTAQGLIVVDVTDGAAPDMPIVTDTVLTAKDRRQLAQGVDVVSGKVQWATGNVADLTLSVWGNAAEKFTVKGAAISGELPAKGALVPFSLSGVDSAGADVVAHGFLRIPAFDDMRVQLRSGVEPLSVGEEKSVEFAVRELLDLDSGESVEVNDDAAFVVQRQNARCVGASTGKAVYDSGREAPWVDTCTIPVRLDGQREWTSVSVPVDIQPKDPQAILNSLTRTIAPGATESVDLYANLTTWEGGREGDLDDLVYSTTFSGSSFIVTQTGTQVSIDARADARPGTRETVQVTVPGFGGLSSAVTLVVGVAAVDAPRAATFTQQCDVSKGASCSITVVGLAGEYDPFAGKVGSGLRLVSVDAAAAASCGVARVAVAGESSVVASWPTGAKPVGGTCVVPFTVQDAQDRTGPGQLTLDVQGYPQAPSSVTTVDYSGTSVTLSVPLGEAAQAHPGVTSVAIFEGGSAVGASCSVHSPAVYRCVVSELANGARHSYTARTVNAIGQSADTTPVETWAYRAPVITSLTAESVYDPARTSGSSGAIDVTVQAEADAVSYRLLANGQTYPRDGQSTLIPLTLPPGTHMIEVIPISQFQPPIGAAGSEGEKKQVGVTAVGSPKYTAHGEASGTATTITLSGAVLDSNSGTRSDQLYVVWQENLRPEPTCTLNTDGTIRASGGTSSSSSTITVPTEEDYKIMACGTNGYGIAQSDSRRANSDPPPGAPSGTLTYGIATDPASPSTSVRRYGLSSEPLVNSKRRHYVLYTSGGVESQTFSDMLRDDYVGTITVAYCRDYFYGRDCGNTNIVTKTTVPTTVTVTFPGSVPIATAATGDRNWVSAAARGAADSSITAAIDETAGTVTYTVTFSGSFAGLAPAVSAPIPLILPDPPIEPPTEPPADPPTEP